MPLSDRSAARSLDLIVRRLKAGAPQVDWDSRAGLRDLIAVPGPMLKTLTYLPRRGPRPIKHVNDDGLLTSAISVQGIYRLAPASAPTSMRYWPEQPRGHSLHHRHDRATHRAPLRENRSRSSSSEPDRHWPAPVLADADGQGRPSS